LLFLVFQEEPVHFVRLVGVDIVTLRSPPNMYSSQATLVALCGFTLLCCVYDIQLSSRSKNCLEKVQGAGGIRLNLLSLEKKRTTHSLVGQNPVNMVNAPHSNSFQNGFTAVKDCSIPPKSQNVQTAVFVNGADTWQNMHNKSMAWDGRMKHFMRFIPENSVVLDLGCGSMHVGKALPQNCTYIPVDAFPRDDPSVLRCDFTQGEYPLQLNPPPTVVVAQGVFEYIFDKALFMRVLGNYKCRVIMTYAVSVWDKTEGHMWVAPLRRSDLELVWKLANLKLVEEDVWGNQGIFILDPI